MKTLTKMFLLCCWCMFSIGFAKQHIDQIQENSEQQAIEEKLTLERQIKEAKEAEKQALKAELEAQTESSPLIYDEKAEKEALELQALEAQRESSLLIYESDQIEEPVKTKQDPIINPFEGRGFTKELPAMEKEVINAFEGRGSVKELPAREKEVINAFEGRGSVKELPAREKDVLNPFSNDHLNKIEILNTQKLEYYRTIMSDDEFILFQEKLNYDGSNSTRDCANASWAGDGWCDGGNNNAGCDWDGGDCCASTCGADGSTTYDCATYGGTDCQDPDASENADAGCDDTEYTWPEGGGSYYSEISWSIDDGSGAGGTTGVAGSGTVCLADGDWIFSACDSWGDGWNGGSFSLSDADGNLVYTSAGPSADLAANEC